MSSRIPPRPISTPSPLPRMSLDTATERTPLTERTSVPNVLRSSAPTPPKARDGDVEKVKVYARIRPALRDDETPGALAWSEDQGQLTIFRPDAPVPQSDFVFTKVLGPACSQADVYAAAVSDVVADVLKGYNGTILAYGQTGAGKTYTLGNTAPDAIGMIPRAAAELFAAATRDPNNAYRITMSYIQIYMEMIQDLLNPQADNLPIREDGNGVFVAGACEVPVASLEECLHYLELGEQNRVFAFTHLNAHSSRSHAVVMLTAVKGKKYLSTEERAQAEGPDQDGVVTQKVTVGKLYMVDLAGSERLKKSKSVGLRATEARSINLSLTMLGMCISARAQDSPHVPFRDSKLTRLLQESLGGNAKTSLILCLSDVRQHADESLQSLQFGARAACVRNKPVVNERLQMRQLTAELLAALEEGHERADGLEAALTQTKDERDSLQAALAREKARSAAIVEALRSEAESKQSQAAAKLAEQATLLSEHQQQLGQVQEQQGQLEMEVARLRDEQRAREEAHRGAVAVLEGRLATAEAEAEAEAEAAEAERQRVEAEARSHIAQLAAAAQRQTAALTARLAAERAAARDHAASIHLALARLHQALGALAGGPAPSSAEEPSAAGASVSAAATAIAAADTDGPAAASTSASCAAPSATMSSTAQSMAAPSAVAAASAAERHMQAGISSGVSGGSGFPPGANGSQWVASLAAAAAAAASRRSSANGGAATGGSGTSGGSTMALIQEALGLTAAAVAAASVDGPACDSAGTSSTAAAGGAANPLLAGSHGSGTASFNPPPPLHHTRGPNDGGDGGGGGAEDGTPTSRPIWPGVPAGGASAMSAPTSIGGDANTASVVGAVACVDGGGGGGGRGEMDLDAAIAAAREDLLADLGAAGARVGAVPSGGGAAATAAVGPSSSSSVTPSAAVASASASAAATGGAGAGVGVGSFPGSSAPSGSGTMLLLPPPSPLRSPQNAAGLTGRLLGRNSNSGTGGSGGSYAAAHAAVLANGSLLSPGGSSYRQLPSSYGQIHGGAGAPLSPGAAGRANGMGYIPAAGLAVAAPGASASSRGDGAGPPSGTGSSGTPPRVSWAVGGGGEGAAVGGGGEGAAVGGGGEGAAVGGGGGGAPPSSSAVSTPARPLALTPAASTSAAAQDNTCSGATAAAGSAAASGTTLVTLSTVTGGASYSGAPGVTTSPSAATAAALMHSSRLNLNPAFDSADSEGFVPDDVAHAAHVVAAAAAAAAGGGGGDSTAAATAAALAQSGGDAAAGTAGMSLGSAAPGAVAGAPPPLFAGIQVQLDALMDMAATARKVKSGLEERVAAQAGELARMQEEQQQVEAGAQEALGHLQSSNRALAAAEARLAATTAELEGARRTIEDTVQALSDTRGAAASRDLDLAAAGARLGELEAQLAEAVGGLEAAGESLQAGEVETARLAAELAKAQADLASERATLRGVLSATARSTEVSARALAARHGLQRQIRAANTIKAAYKRFKLLQLRGAVAARQQELAAAEAGRHEHEAAVAARQSQQAARAGQALVQESVGVMQEAVEAILTAFVGRRFELNARRSLNERLAKMMPSPLPALTTEAGGRGGPAGLPKVRSGGGVGGGGGGGGTTPLQARHRQQSLTLMLNAATAPSASKSAGAAATAAAATSATTAASGGAGGWRDIAPVPIQALQ